MTPQFTANKTTPARRRRRPRPWQVALIVVASLVCAGGCYWLFMMWQLNSGPWMQPRSGRWVTSGEQELMQVFRGSFQWSVWKQQPLLCGTFLCYQGTWRALPQVSEMSGVFADNGVIMVGPLIPELQLQGEYYLIQNGQLTPLFTGQELVDAASKILGPQPRVRLLDAIFQADAALVKYRMIYYGNQVFDDESPGVVEAVWDGSQIVFNPCGVPLCCEHEFSGGHASLQPQSRHGYMLALQLDSTDNESNATTMIDLFSEVNCGYTLVGGFADGSVWMINNLKQHAVRRALPSWEIVEERDLNATLKSIPRKLLREMQPEQTSSQR